MRNKPVPRPNEVILARFNATLSKARMMFETVDEHRYYQCALVYNRGFTEPAVVYAKHNGEIMVKQLELKANETEIEWEDDINARKPLIVVRSKDEKGAVTGRGLLAYNGKRILPSIYSYRRIDYLDNFLIIAEKEKDIKIKEFVPMDYGIYNFYGKKLISGKGIAYSRFGYHYSGKRFIHCDNYRERQHEVYIYSYSNRELYEALVVPMTEGLNFDWYRGKPSLIRMNENKIDIVQSWLGSELIKTAKLIYSEN